MFINSKPASIIFKSVIAVLSCFAFIAQLFVDGSFSAKPLMFFSVMSDLFIFLFYLISVLYLTFNRSDLRTSVACVANGMSMIAIILSGAVYSFVIAPSSSAWRFELLSLAGIVSLIMHFILPVLVLFDWALFDRKGRWKLRHVFAFVAPPAAYAAFIYGLPLFGGKAFYPYSFMDPANGGGKLAVSLLLVFGVYLAASLIFIALDRLLGEIAHRRCAV